MPKTAVKVSQDVEALQAQRQELRGAIALLHRDEQTDAMRTRLLEISEEREKAIDLATLDRLDAEAANLRQSLASRERNHHELRDRNQRAIERIDGQLKAEARRAYVEASRPAWGRIAQQIRALLAEVEAAETLRREFENEFGADVNDARPAGVREGLITAGIAAEGTPDGPEYHDRGNYLRAAAR